MKAKDIVAGGKYIAKVSGKVTTVRVDEIREISHRVRPSALGTSRANYNRSGIHYDVTNLATGRKITFRSASKFRRVVGDPSGAFEGRLKRLAERGAAGLITTEEQDKQHPAIVADEQRRRNLGKETQS